MLEDTQEYLESDQDVLFVLKVDMGQGIQKFIQFRNGDSPEDLAFEFCQAYQLNIKVYDFISDALKQKYHQLQTGQLIETRNKGVMTKQGKKSSARKSDKSLTTTNAKSASNIHLTDSARLAERETANTLQHNLFASSSARFQCPEIKEELESNDLEVPRPQAPTSYVGIMV